MELKAIDNLIKPNFKQFSNLGQNKNLIKKFLFDKDNIKIKDKKVSEKENAETSNISLNITKNNDSKNVQQTNKNQECESYIDFRDEIEKRFRKSVINKIYIFPRKIENDLSENSSSNSSNDSLKNIELYDLKFQLVKPNICSKARKTQEIENERKNLSFQDFLSKIQGEKEKWKCRNQTNNSLSKKIMNVAEETQKKQNKSTLKNSESVLLMNKSTDKNEETRNKVNFSLNKRASKERDKIVKGRKTMDINNFSMKQKINVSGSNSKPKDNSNSNIFYAINSFHNKLFPKDK